MFWRERVLRFFFRRYVRHLEHTARSFGYNEGFFRAESKTKKENKELRKLVASLTNKNKELETTLARYRSKGKAPLRIRKLVLQEANYRCHYCGLWADTVDHLIPRSRGGSDGKQNLVACCEPCNTEKGDMTHLEYFDLLEAKRLYNAEQETKV